jgi:hypothetical protein
VCLSARPHRLVMQDDDFVHAPDLTPEEVVAPAPRTMDGLRRPHPGLFGRWPKGDLDRGVGAPDVERLLGGLGVASRNGDEFGRIPGLRVVATPV